MAPKQNPREAAAQLRAYARTLGIDPITRLLCMKQAAACERAAALVVPMATEVRSAA